MKKDCILILAANTDDAIIGAGGTLAKYAEQGKIIKTIICSYGELSHPHLKREIIAKRRVEEAIESEKIIGGDGLLFLGLRDTHFVEELRKENIRKMIKNIIDKEKPTKIFTHSPNDPLVKHRCVYNTLIKLNPNAEIYSFDIWNIINFKNRNAPKLIVDISKTFQRKLQALKAHKSQSITIGALTAKIYIKDITNGINNNCKFAEVFVKHK